ncbi:hypothetical protein L228DRAFT_96127 [Xylona heveae TC161]|uniref:Uncharacterized protein n=1 Tax=Xylona heveae (strain CBS 132557 / TC161) TaxID=1328760 RepID=A0A165I5K2_XYLHT|nr:hypothetical protein L228DRAFT_96127 [Xylona heveae TC161]KZF24418.1 hypothetical protein L228DRAFT_96127 [Xylona heveae TC161]
MNKPYYRNNSTRPNAIFFRPEIDCILKGMTGYDATTNILLEKKEQFFLTNMRLEHSELESRRRLVRLEIVYVAERLWEGDDPYPEVRPDPVTGEMVLYRDPKVPQPGVFRIYRERFAPTDKLRHFLFPCSALAHEPSKLPYSAARGWLFDPTLRLRSTEDFAKLGKHWYINTALFMLNRLIDFRHECYYMKGRGGFVTGWVEAAKDWHLKRLENELVSGATFRLEKLSNGQREHKLHYNLFKVMDRLGLEPNDQCRVPAVPRRPEFSDNLSDEDFLQLDEAALVAQGKRALQIKQFEKVIRYSCTRCPETGGLYYPIGFEGLIEHMRIGHATLFWEGCFHSVG